MIEDARHDAGAHEDRRGAAEERRTCRSTLFNQLLTKKEISGMIDAVYRNCGQKETVIFCDRIMALGFHHAFKAGISFGKDDMVIPETKGKIVNETRDSAASTSSSTTTASSRRARSTTRSSMPGRSAPIRVADEMMDRISANQKTRTGREKQVNSIYMMSAFGCARLAGADEAARRYARPHGQASGEIIETPIISNFKEGLSVLEYFNSTHGARKGLADTALKTANSGYLTRRLVDVAQDSIINEEDCGTDGGIKVQAVVDAGQVIVSLGARVLGRTAAEDVCASRPTAARSIISRRAT